MTKYQYLFKITIVLSLTLIGCSLSAVSAQNGKLGFNETKQIIEKSNKPFPEKYKLAYSHFTPKEQIAINNMLIQQAYKEKDKQYLIMLYCKLYSLSNDDNQDIDNNKLYLDSAYTYINQTSSNDALGTLYYYLGSYYSQRPNVYDSNRLQLEYFYKSIPYFERSENLHYKLADVYSLISYAYITQKDYISSKTILDKMSKLKVNNSNTEKASLFYLYSAASDYYSGLKTTLLNPILQPNDTIPYYTYIDSAVYFINKTIQVYSSLKDSLPADVIPKRLVATAYFDLALEKSLKYTIHQDKNWSEVFNYLEEGKQYLDSTNHIGWVNYYFTKGRIYQGLKEFQEAKIQYLKVKQILDNNPNMFNIDQHYLRLYKQLVVVNVRIENLHDALLYQIFYSNTQEKLYTAERYKTIKELEVKYETVEKELEISKLNEEKQKTHSRIIIGIAIIVILIIILVIGLLYNRIQRLKKSKEADELASRITQREMEFQLLAKETEQRLTRRYLDGREEEKTRLAKELHDTVANEVVSIIMQLESGKNINFAIESLKEEHNKIRNISHRLMPKEFEFISFIDMVLDYIDMLNQTGTIHFDCVYDEEQIALFDSMPKHLSVELYNIVQESINNIIKHSGADKAEVNMKFTDEDNHFVLSIRDNGKGFDTSQVYKGIGLRTIKDRCSDINAEFSIISSSGKGCTITISSICQEQPPQV